MKSLKEQHLDPSETIYIGDDLEKDYMTSKKIGMNAFLLIRDKNFPKSVPKEFILEKLEDLLEKI